MSKAELIKQKMYGSVRYEKNLNESTNIEENRFRSKNRDSLVNLQGYLKIYLAKPFKVMSYEEVVTLINNKKTVDLQN